MHQSEEITQGMSRVQFGAWVVGGVALAISALVAFQDIDRFFSVYLVAYLFVIEVVLGCLGLLMVANLVGGKWSFVVMRFAAAGARTMPLMALGFLPLLLGMETLYPWVEEGVVKGNKEFYLTPALFFLRALIYFAIWIGLAYGITELSYRNDGDNPNKTDIERSKLISIIGLMALFLTCTFAAVDWSMSVDAKWFSSVYGWLAMSRMALGAFAVLYIAVWLFKGVAPIKRLLNGQAWSDLGTLAFAALAVWAYLSAMQYLIYWAGNIQSKVFWYEIRLEGVWGSISGLIVLFHLIPFVLILTPGLMRVRWVGVVLMGLLLFMRLVEMFWTVIPSINVDYTFYFVDLALPIALSALTLGMALWSLKAHPLIPGYHPDLENALTQEDGEGYRDVATT
jgi:hypothetical protein